MRTLTITDRKKIDEIIRQCKICYVSMSADNVPYVLPMNFALNGDTVVLHSGKNGRMWDILHKNPAVCINWTIGDEIAWQDIRIACSYTIKSFSVLAEGLVEFTDSYEEKERCLSLFMAQYSSREFKFNSPSVKNVGIIKVHVNQFSCKEFGAGSIRKPLQ
mgnify:CR=1 FL=1